MIHIIPGSDHTQNRKAHNFIHYDYKSHVSAVKTL